MHQVILDNFGDSAVLAVKLFAGRSLWVLGRKPIASAARQIGRSHGTSSPSPHSEVASSSSRTLQSEAHYDSLCHFPALRLTYLDIFSDVCLTFAHGTVKEMRPQQFQFSNLSKLGISLIQLAVTLLHCLLGPNSSTI